MKRLFALGLTLVAVVLIGCEEDKKPTSVFILDGLMIESPSGTRYGYIIIAEENDPVEEWTQAINVQGETFIVPGFHLVVVIRDPESTVGNITVTWAQGDAQIEEIKPGDNCFHVYVTEDYPTIIRDCDTGKSFSEP